MADGKAKVFINSYPKSGTNLVQKLFDMNGYRQLPRALAMTSVLGRKELLKKLIRACPLFDYTVPIGIEVPVSVRSRWLKRYVGKMAGNSYFTGHAAWSDYLEYLMVTNNIKVIFIVRDPRAIISSMARFIVEDVNSWYPFHDDFKSMSREQLIKFLIQGGYCSGAKRYYSGIAAALQRVEGWLDSSVTKVVRFEDIVGSKGGGSDDEQYRVLSEIAEFVGDDGWQLENSKSNLFGGTHTFRTGQVDGWRKDFDEEMNLMIIDELKVAGVMRRLGYQDFK